MFYTFFFLIFCLIKKILIVMVEFSYKNESCRMIVLRCIGSSNFFLERVLFPTDIITFMAPNDSRVEIWGNELYGPKLEQRIRVSSDNEDSRLVA